MLTILSCFDTMQKKGDTENEENKSRNVPITLLRAAGRQQIFPVLCCRVRRRGVQDRVQLEGRDQGTETAVRRHRSQLVRCTNYFKIVANFTTGDKQSSDVKTFKVTEQAPRNLYVGNMPNFRDMGGRTTYAGGKVKQGLIYRGAGSKFDYSSTPNADAQYALLQQFKLKTEINVADKTDNNLKLDGTEVKDCFMLLYELKC